jgi:hypothetical protein
MSPNIGMVADIKSAGILRLPNEALNDPEKFTCKSQSLVDITNRQRQIHLDKSRSGGVSSEERENLVVSSVNYPSDTHRVQWHLRRRESSDRSIQPHAAPRSFAAQQSENFQRFYRAVVSPTHVRVTAGGRIVPNTRSLAPPVFEWNKDKFVFEPQKTLPDNHLVALQHAHWQQSLPLPTVFPHPLPTGGYPTSYDHSPQVTSLASTTMGSDDRGDTAGADKPKVEGYSTNLNGEPTSENVHNGALPHQIQLSHPSQFDQSKPFMFNGHVVYPLPAGHQPPPHALPVPFTVLGNPNFAPQHVPSFTPQHTAPSAPSFLPQPLHFPFGQSPSHMILPMMHQQAIPLPHPTESVPNTVSFSQAPGIISASEVSKFQIQGFYAHLKYIDNQIAANGHQADEIYMIRQRNDLMATITKMEATLEAQLINEGKTSIDKPRNRDLGIHLENHHLEGSKDNIDDPLENKRSDRESLVSGDGQANSLNQAIFSKPKSVPIHMSAPGEQTKLIIKTEPIRIVDTNGFSKQAPRSEPLFKSKLTAAAAMAPPFQPRAKEMVASNSFTESDSPMEMHFPADAHLNYRGYASLSTAHSMQDTLVHSADGSLSPPYDLAHTFHGTGGLSASNSQPIISPQVVPYLVGVLPQGVNASDAKATDLVYSRPLTDEEVRARFLYWGKAPRFVQSGLPKFDGKDFYPPSPVKQTAQTVYKPFEARTALVGSSQNLEKYFPGTPNGQAYKTPSPVGTSPRLPIIAASPTQELFETGVVSFQPPSPQPSAYRFDSGASLPTQIFGETGYAEYRPVTSVPLGYAPSVPAVVNGESSASLDQDFSYLFLERGVPGYKSPIPPPKPSSKMVNADGDTPTTPANRRKSVKSHPEDNETATVDSWGAPATETQWHEDIEIVASLEPDMDDRLSDTSTVEINLTTKVDGDELKIPNGIGSRDHTFDLTR